MDQVRVWIVPVDVPPADVARCWDVLDRGELSRAAAFLSARERQQFTVAHGVLRILAGHALRARPGDLTWIAGPHGKPELAPTWPGLRTSLSHSAEFVAVALSADRPVGVDIQHLLADLDPMGLASRYFPAREAGYIAAGDPAERADRFAQLWVRKEAVVKAAGSRLWPNLKIAVYDRDVVRCAVPAGAHRVRDVEAPAGYRAAVALAGAAPFVVSVRRIATLPHRGD